MSRSSDRLCSLVHAGLAPGLPSWQEAFLFSTGTVILIAASIMESSLNIVNRSGMKSVRGFSRVPKTALVAANVKFRNVCANAEFSVLKSGDEMHLL